MTDAGQAALITGLVTLVVSAFHGLGWLMRERKARKSATKATIDAKNDELKELYIRLGRGEGENAALRARVRELEREKKEWQKNRP